jgi:hypothetical protein
MRRVDIDDDLTITSGWPAAALCTRRSVTVEPSSMQTIDIVRRGALEPLIENRVLGLGTSIGRRRRGRARVGRFLGPAIVGE